jgi:hypothetical protein
MAENELIAADLAEVGFRGKVAWCAVCTLRWMRKAIFGQFFFAFDGHDQPSHFCGKAGDPPSFS